MYNYIEKKKIFTISGIIYNRGAYNLFSKIGGIVIFLICRQDNKKVNQPTNCHQVKDQTPHQSNKISQGYHQQDCCSPQNDQKDKRR